MKTTSNRLVPLIIGYPISLVRISNLISLSHLPLPHISPMLIVQTIICQQMETSTGFQPTSSLICKMATATGYITQVMEAL